MVLRCHSNVSGTMQSQALHLAGIPGQCGRHHHLDHSLMYGPLLCFQGCCEVGQPVLIGLPQHSVSLIYHLHISLHDDKNRDADIATRATVLCSFVTAKAILHYGQSVTEQWHRVFARPVIHNLCSCNPSFDTKHIQKPVSMHCNACTSSIATCSTQDA